MEHGTRLDRRGGDVTATTAAILRRMVEDVIFGPLPPPAKSASHTEVHHAATEPSRTRASADSSRSCSRVASSLARQRLALDAARATTRPSRPRRRRRRRSDDEVLLARRRQRSGARRASRSLRARAAASARAAHAGDHRASARAARLDVRRDRATGLGFDGKRVEIPVHDQTGDLVGFTRYQPNAQLVEPRTASRRCAPTGHDARAVPAARDDRRQRTVDGCSRSSRASPTHGSGRSASPLSASRARRTGATSGQRVSRSTLEGRRLLRLRRDGARERETRARRSR